LRINIELYLMPALI